MSEDNEFNRLQKAVDSGDLWKKLEAAAKRERTRHDMLTVMDYGSTDFAAEVQELFSHSDFNFGKGAIPIDIVRGAVLKSVCGWHNGSTAKSIIVHLGYVIPRQNKSDKLTPKGKAFLWWAFHDMLPSVDTNGL